MESPLENVELTAAVQGLRDQLIAASSASVEQRIKFEIDEIVLDFTVELRRDLSTKAGFKAWVISGDVQSSAAKGTTHRVSIKMRPKYAADGSSVDIGNDQQVNLGVFDRNLEGGKG